MEFIGWCLQELLCSLERRSFAGRLQDSGVDQVREDRIQVIFKFVTVSDLSADGIHLQTIIDRLEEEITASKKFFSVIVHKSVGMERDRNNCLFRFFFIFFRFDSCLFFCPRHDAIPISAKTFR